VGVGISGEEGLQAVNSSDYAIAQVSLDSVESGRRGSLIRLVPAVPLPEKVASRSWALVVCAKRKYVRVLFVFLSSEADGSCLLGLIISSIRI
jgi:hypothetical protein